MEFNNLSAMYAYIQEQLNDTLTEEVAETVKEEWSNSVREVVYASGTPIQYERRNFENGSLGDINSMSGLLVGNGILEVTNNAEAQSPLSGISLSGLIEGGYGTRDTWYNEPREVVERTREELSQSGKVDEAIRVGLQKRGITANVEVHIT